jgi:NAD(P)-dependent dehydrogenase (short-subunit alcohol dehydrogenase family)
MTSDFSHLVTGASTGIGRACVAALVPIGGRVWASVRTDADEESLTAEFGSAVRVTRLDVTDAASIEAAGAAVRAAGPLHGLVNNAGVALPGPLEHIPIATFRRQLEVNLVGQLAVTQAMLPALREARAGSGGRASRARILMIGSIGGRVAGPMLGAYHAAKFGLVGLTDSLRAELAPSGIEVVLIEPGAIATPIWGRGAAAGDELLAQLSPGAIQRYEAQIEQAQSSAARSAVTGLPPDRVAQVVMTALTTERPRPRYLVGRDAQIAAVVARLPFRLRYRLTAAKRLSSGANIYGSGLANRMIYMRPSP